MNAGESHSTAHAATRGERCAIKVHREAKDSTRRERALGLSQFHVRCLSLVLQVRVYGADFLNLIRRQISSSRSASWAAWAGCV